jgi:hypothetical protein
MTTLQVETKAFPTSIPNTISHNPVSPSSQFLSFYSASEWLRRAESISSTDESGAQDGPSLDTGPGSRRLSEAEKLASLKTRVAAAASRGKAKPGRQNNFTRPISPVEDVRPRYKTHNLYTDVERLERNSLREIPRSRPRKITEDVERQEFRRPVREDSDLSIGEIRRDYPLRPLDFADYEANGRRLLQPEGDSSSEDDGPIIPRTRRPENRYWDDQRRQTSDRWRSPPPLPPERLRSLIYRTRERVRERSPLPPSMFDREVYRERVVREPPQGIITHHRHVDRGDYNPTGPSMQTRRPQMPMQANGQDLPPFTASFSAVERDRLNHMRAPQETRIESSYGLTYSDDIGYYSDAPARDYPFPPPVNNSPPLLTGKTGRRNYGLNSIQLYQKTIPGGKLLNMLKCWPNLRRIDLACLAYSLPCKLLWKTKLDPWALYLQESNLLDLPKAALDLRDLQCQYKFSSNRPESAT